MTVPRFRLAPLHCRPWTLNGLSPRLIESHYENNYGGALRRLNAVSEQLDTLDPDSAPGHLLAALKGEELAALNSVQLHELYFASLGGDGQPTSLMTEVLAGDFGSYRRWRTEFRAAGYALDGRPGWALLTYLPREGRLINAIVVGDGDAVAGGIPLLALDMHEHAYHIDFGANARAYVDTFMRNIDWPALELRFDRAHRVMPLPPREQPEFGSVPGVALEEMRDLIAAGKPLQVIDVRPRHFVSRQQDIAGGVAWRDPELVHEWMHSLSKSEPVVVYCAYGFHVGCTTAGKLREAGFDARYMNSGHSGWRALGGAVERLP